MHVTSAPRIGRCSDDDVRTVSVDAGGASPASALLATAPRGSGSNCRGGEGRSRPAAERSPSIEVTKGFALSPASSLACGTSGPHADSDLVPVAESLRSQDPTKRAISKSHSCEGSGDNGGRSVGGKTGGRRQRSCTNETNMKPALAAAGSSHGASQHGEVARVLHRGDAEPLAFLMGSRVRVANPPSQRGTTCGLAISVHALRITYLTARAGRPGRGRVSLRDAVPTWPAHHPAGKWAAPAPSCRRRPTGQPCPLSRTRGA